MRMAIPLILAAALAASGPALAQDANNSVATNDVAATNATDANAVAAVPANDVAAAPAAEPATTDAAQPVPAEKKGGFPWGVIGLLGLIGLIPRKGR